MPSSRSALSARLLATWLTALAIVAPATAQKRAESGWAEGLFPIPGVDDGWYGGGGDVLGVVAYNNGGGPDLYIGGEFLAAGAQWIRGLTCWDGQTWHEVGGGLNGDVKSMLVFDDGSGAALYVSGTFTQAGGRDARVARWDGSRWEPLDAGLQTPDFGVVAMIVFDDGGGPALHAASGFVNEGTKLYQIVRWDGQTWSSDSTPVDDGIRALGVFDDGSGPAIFAGGDFTFAGGVEANRIAKWDGRQWSALGLGMGTSNDFAAVSTLAVFDDGSGPALFAGGWFNMVDGMPVKHIAKWDGQAWSPVGDGVDNPVHALVVHDDGVGRALYVGGGFYRADGKRAFYVARWDGRNWSSLAPGIILGSRVRSLSVADDGNGPALYIGGSFYAVHNSGARNVARWDGQAWSGLGEGINGFINTMLAVDEPAEQALYIGGRFHSAGRQTTTHLAKWNGRAWAPVGDDLDGDVQSLIHFDDGNGMALYAGGRFDRSGSTALSRIARWNGREWQPLGAGFRHERFLREGSVYALAVFDDGDGPQLYAGGSFTHSGSVRVDGIARWDGADWQPLGAGVRHSREYYGYLSSMAVFDDGNGPALIVGGRFDSMDGKPISGLAKWDGSTWEQIGGFDGHEQLVTAMRLHESDEGPALYIAGGIGDPRTREVYSIVKWTGTHFVPMDAGLKRVSHYFRSLEVHDDGSGPTLYVGGTVLIEDGSGWSHNFAKWNGERWVTPGGRVYGWPRALAAFNDGYGPALYVGGQFTRLGDTLSSALARWGPPIVMGDMNCDGSVDLGDVDPFLIALLAIEAYRDQHPDCGWRRGDVNDDGSLDATDVEPFIELLLG